MGRYTPEAIGDYCAGPNHVRHQAQHVFLRLVYMIFRSGPVSLCVLNRAYNHWHALRISRTARKSGCSCSLSPLSLLRGFYKEFRAVRNSPFGK